MSAGGIGGTGTTGTIPKFSATSTLADSVIVESSGNIGIGVAPTLGKLEVSGITAASSFLFGTSSNLWYQSATETATLRIGTTPSYLNFINSSGAPMIDAPSGTLYFGTSGTVRARISPNGYLGIGGDPEVSGINTAIYAKSAFGSPTGGVPYGGIWISSTDSAAIDKGGVLSLGGSYTGTTDTRFAAIAGLKEDSTDGNYGGYLALYTRPNGGSPLERMHISASGNVGIGCTPNQKFEVQGSSGVTQRIGTSSSSFYIQHNGTSDTHIYTGDAAALRFGTNSTERLKITSSGEIITSATGGTSGSGSPAIASGTYTPTAASLTGGVSAVTPKVCHWMRIGNIVTVGLLLEITSSTAGSFTLTLPTTTANFSSALQAQGIIGTHGAVVSGKITSTVSAQTITVNATSSLTGITYDGTITYQVQ
jgi:hypothetical protein